MQVFINKGLFIVSVNRGPPCFNPTTHITPNLHFQVSTGRFAKLRPPSSGTVQLQVCSSDTFLINCRLAHRGVVTFVDGHYLASVECIVFAAGALG